VAGSGHDFAELPSPKGGDGDPYALRHGRERERIRHEPSALLADSSDAIAHGL